MTTRDRAYRRDIRSQQIRRKKRICQQLYGQDWYSQDGRYNKGKIYCSCWICKPAKYIHKMPTFKDAIKRYVFELEKEEYTGEGCPRLAMKKMKHASGWGAGL